MQLEDFYYELPPHLIASRPLEQRSASRLMHVSHHEISHYVFSDILQLISPGDLLVFNDTKVIPARLFVTKETGGKAEILVERILDESHFLVQMKVSKPPKTGDRVYLNAKLFFTVLEKKDRFYKLFFDDAQFNLWDILKQFGKIPLPHYMQREADDDDIKRYQTVYAKYDGSVAAPTAGLHFDEGLMAKLQHQHVQCAYLTLHVGAGTFAPVRCENITDHHMHREWFDISPDVCAQIARTKAAGKKVIAVGTTSLRALESAAYHGQVKPMQGETDIFIYPGFQFKCVDALITNFHLPHSTLLMLVCAFAGHEKMLNAYKKAVQLNYRFFSYGDAMLIERC